MLRNALLSVLFGNGLITRPWYLSPGFDGGGGGAGGGGNPDPPPPDPDPPADPPPDPADADLDKLGDAGKRAIDRMKADKAAAEKAAKAEKKRADEMEARLAELEAGTKSENEKALEAARKESAEKARSETLATVNRQRLEDRVRALAGTKVADPEDAVRLLDLDEFEIADDGTIESKPIADAIDALLKSKPYLAPKGTKAEGDGDGGARDQNKGGMAAGRERAKADREARQSKERDPFAGMTVAGRDTR